MAKLKPRVVFSDHPEKDYMCRAYSPNEDLNNLWTATIPGTKNLGGVLEIPRECLEQAQGFVDRFGLEVVNNSTKDSNSNHIQIKHHMAYDYQREGAEALLRKGRYMLNYEMGLGKTLSTILALKEYKPEKTLIISPAMVRLSWADELKKWWPNHSKISIIDASRKAPDGDIVIAGYKTVKSVLRKKHKWDAIVADESHYVMNAGSERSVNIRQLTQANPNAMTAFLTATPITCEPLNLHNQLDMLWPGRMGSTGEFASYYCGFEENAWGKKYSGLNEDHAQELNERLQHMALRVTKHEVADIMPPFIVTPLRIRPHSTFNVKELTNQLLRTDRHNAKVDRIVERFGREKRSVAAEWAANAVQSGSAIVATYYRKAAKGIVAELEQGNRGNYKIFHFDGDTSIPKRRSIVEAALKSKNSILVCTMSSVKEGINTLTGFENALVAEMYYTPGLMLQFLGRLHRLNGSCNVTLLMFEGSWEEIIAFRLQERMRANGMLQRSAVTGEALNAAIDGDESKEEAFESMREIAAGRIEEDVYC